MKTTLRFLPLGQLDPGTFNPRKTFQESEEAELAESVKIHGIVQPLIVRAVGDRFEVVAGERRYRAAKTVGLGEVPAVVRELTELEAVELAVIENLQRVDVSPFEEAEGFARLIAEAGYSVESLAAKLGKSAQTIYARLQLRGVAPQVEVAVGQKLIPASVVSLIASRPHEEQLKVLEKVLGTAGPGQCNPVTARTFKRALAERQEEAMEESDRLHAAAKRREAANRKRDRQAKAQGEEQREREEAERKGFLASLVKVCEEVDETMFLARAVFHKRGYGTAPGKTAELKQLCKLSVAKLRFLLLVPSRDGKLYHYEVEPLAARFMVGLMLQPKKPSEMSGVELVAHVEARHKHSADQPELLTEGAK